MYQSLFEEEIGAVPPSTVDVDRVVRRRRRRQALRTVLAATTAGAVAAGLIVMTVAASPDASGPAERFGGDPEGSASPSVDAVAVRLTAELKRYLDGTVPGARYYPNRSRLDPPVDPLVFTREFIEAKPENPGKQGGQDGEDYYRATADVEDASGTGSIAVGVGWAGPETLGLTGICAEEGPLDVASWSCTPETGPGGEKITVTDQRGSKAVMFRIEVVRPGGMAVFVEVTNQAGRYRTSEFDGDRSDSPQPTLTIAEAKDLALSPALTI